MLGFNGYRSIKMLSQNMVSKILNAGVASAITGVLLGSAFTTASWGMDKGTIGEELGFTRTAQGTLVSPYGPNVASRTIRSAEDVKTIWSPQKLSYAKDYYNSLRIELPSAEVDRLSISFSMLPNAYPFLERLSIKQTTLGHVEHGHLRIKELTDVLANNRTIKSLTLLKCAVDDEGAIRLANALRNNSTLEELRLDFNRIGDKGIVALGETLKVNKSLKKFTIVGNKNITDSGIGIFGQILANLPTPTLKHLDFGGYTSQKPQNLKNAFRDLLTKKGYDVAYF